MLRMGPNVPSGASEFGPAKTPDADDVEQDTAPERPSKYAVSVLIQYFKHPHTLMPILARLLQHSAVEVIVNADSNSSADHSAFSRAAARYPDSLVVVHSDNVHELRGYNRAAARARSPLLVFAQDDHLPPARAHWVEWLVRIFGAVHSLGGVGLNVGVLPACEPGKNGTCSLGTTRKVGQCNTAPAESVVGALHYHDSLVPHRRPLTFALSMLLPMAVRRTAFLELGMFNTSMSAPGQGALGFEHVLATQLWARGHAIAIGCSAPELIWRNGCGGRGTWVNHGGGHAAYELRRRSVEKVRAVWEAEFGGAAGIAAQNAHTLSRVSHLQKAIDSDPTLQGQLRRAYAVLPHGCDFYARSTCNQHAPDARQSAQDDWACWKHEAAHHDVLCGMGSHAAKPTTPPRAHTPGSRSVTCTHEPLQGAASAPSGAFDVGGGSGGGGGGEGSGAVRGAAAREQERDIDDDYDGAAECVPVSPHAARATRAAASHICWLHGH